MTLGMVRGLVAGGCAVGCGVSGLPLASLAARLAKRPIPAASMVVACAVVGGAVGAIVPGGSPARLGVGLFLGLCLSLLVAVDLVALRLPDIVTLPLAAVGLLMAALPRCDAGEGLAARLAGAVIGFAVLAATAWAFRRTTGREGLGMGDAKLFGAAGAWLGWDLLPQVLLVGCAIGLAWVAVLVLVRGVAALRRPIPFGPALCAGFLGVWLAWG